MARGVYERPAERGQYDKPRTSKRSLYINDLIYEKIKEMAEKKEITTAKLINEILYQYVKKQIEN